MPPTFSPNDIAGYLRKYNVTLPEDQLGSLSQLANQIGVGGFSGNGAGGFAGVNPMDALTGGGAVDEGGLAAPPPPQMPASPADTMSASNPLAGGQFDRATNKMLNAQQPQQPPQPGPLDPGALANPQGQPRLADDQMRYRIAPQPGLADIPGGGFEQDQATRDMNEMLNRIDRLGQGRALYQQPGLAPAANAPMQALTPMDMRRPRRRPY